MNLDDEDRDAKYSEGWKHGRRDFIRNIRKEVGEFHRQRNEFHRQRNKWTDLLSDPEKLAALASENPEFNEAMTTAVLALIFKDADLEEEWKSTEENDD